MFAFWFLEKPNSNPHWHGLVRFFSNCDTLHEVAVQEGLVCSLAEPVWKRLVPSGSVKVRPITCQNGIAKYVAKELGNELSYNHFITPDEFQRG